MAKHMKAVKLKPRYARPQSTIDELVIALRGMVEAYRDQCSDDEQPSMVRAAIIALANADA